MLNGSYDPHIGYIVDKFKNPNIIASIDSLGNFIFKKTKNKDKHLVCTLLSIMSTNSTYIGLEKEKKTQKEVEFEKSLERGHISDIPKGDNDFSKD